MLMATLKPYGPVFQSSVNGRLTNHVAGDQNVRKNEKYLIGD